MPEAPPPVDVPSLQEAWPLFELELRHEDTSLRVLTDADALALVQLLEEPIVGRGEEHFMPGLLLARADTPQERTRAFLQHHWGVRARHSAKEWTLPFTVRVDGVIVGSQAISASEFALLREVHTGSYLAGIHQGRGTGARMRAMVLEFAFAHLGASCATSGYVTGNERSARISRRLGYLPNGEERKVVAGRVITNELVRLSWENWLTHRPSWLDEMVVTGLPVCLPLLGLSEMP